MPDKNAIKLLDESPAENPDNSLPHKQTCNSILNIIDNNKNVLRKVILLSGVRGSGKTTIIQKLIRENEKDKIFITIDAWNAPENVLKKEFLRCLFRNVLDQRGKIKKGKYADHLKNPLDKLLKDIDTIEKNVKSNINFITILIYCFVFIGIPILTYIKNSPLNNINFNSQHYYILFLIILLISFMFKNYIVKILFPFLYGSSDSYSEYEEGKDLTPYQFKQFVKKFYSLYSDFFDKDVVIVVDNMDRLSKDEEEKFISSLYTFIECMQKKDDNINIWFILAVDKKNIGKNNSSVDNSFYDKLSPYEVSIPEMNNFLVGTYFKKELFNNFDNNIIKEIKNLDQIYLLLDFFKEDNTDIR
ncbi:P-loop NTPase fold protein [Brachyspira sp. SAP_772]|uniref:P-loop NTPase fold protein n=1 Tax=Brachyspira sp. SAP_772 TaxID=2608385 RepID=UPI0012F50D35|nr:P-loop NTPase fold protein [Brachyspira sp. SAP_772]